MTCTWGSVAGGATKQAKITVTVDSLPAGPDHDHLIDVQKAEAHLDLNPGQTRTLSVSCPSGYLVSDGSGRVDHVDQGTGTLGSVFVTESRATGLDTWQVTATNEATGRAQAKVFAVCVQQTTAANQGHDHQLELGGEVTKTVALGAGSATTTLSCGPGELPARPGYVLDGTAAVVVSYPDGAGGWEFSVERGAGDATSVDLSLGCVESQLSESAGHRHALDLAEVRDQVTVPAGQVTEVTLTCPVGYKGVVAGWDVDPGLVNLGNDPRPISRVFKFYNPTGSDLDAHVWLGCLSTRTAGGNAARTVTNTATVTTTSTDTGSGANTDSAGITVKSGTAPASPAAPKVALKGARKVLAKVECEASECGGTAKLVATKTQKVKGTKIRKGQLLAKGRYSLDEGQKRSVTLKATGKGKKVLKKIRKATLKLGSSTRVVKVR